MTDLKHISQWCSAYSENTKIKVYPQSAPILAIIDDLMGVIAKHQAALMEISQAMLDMNAQIKLLAELTKPEEKTPKAVKKEVKK